MLYLFDAEMMSSQDLMWMRNGDQNTGNWTTGVIFEKFDYDNMKDYLLRITDNVHRLRCKQVKILGHWYFQKMTDDEWAEKKKVFISRDDSIRTEDDIVDAMVRLQQVRPSYDHVQMRMIMVPNYSETESVIIYNGHHSLMDG